MSVNVELDADAVDELIGKLSDDTEALRRAILEAAAQAMADVMSNLVPVRTGFMKDSITADDYGDFFMIGPNSGYSLFVDQGTQGPYDIYPVSAKALRIVLPDGTVLFRKHVVHPGIQDGAHFIEQTLQDSESEVGSIIESAIDEWFRGGI